MLWFALECAFSELEVGKARHIHSSKELQQSFLAVLLMCERSLLRPVPFEGAVAEWCPEARSLQGATCIYLLMKLVRVW